MNEVTAILASVERMNLILAGLVLSAGGILLGLTPEWGGLCAGVVAGLLNFRAIGFIASKLVHSGEKAKIALMALFFVKFGLLAVSCYLLVVVIQVAVMPFLVGISTLLVALVIHSFRYTMAPASGSVGTSHVPTIGEKSPKQGERA
ncbi:MAG: hypothetical protein HUU55_17715 [Myxococcales bacterium]|nr:hypothetical protein [Myxococcales bacterium]